MSEAEPHHHFCYLLVSIFAEGVRLDSSKHSLHPLLLLCLQLTAGAQHPSDWRSIPTREGAVPLVSREKAAT